MRGIAARDDIEHSLDVIVFINKCRRTMPTSTTEEKPAKPSGRKPLTPPMLYLGAALIVIGSTGIAAAIRAVYAVPDLEVLYFVAVMIVGVNLGRGPSILAAALGVLSYDLFFVPPFYTLNVSDSRYVLTFAMMFGVGLLMSELTSRIRRQERDARHREQRTAVLYALSRELAGADGDRAIADIVAHHANGVFGVPALVLRADETGALRTLAASPSSMVMDAKDLGVARWAFEHGKSAGFGTNTLPGSKMVCAPLIVGDTTLGVLALEPESPFGAEQSAFMDAFCRQSAFALERVRLATEARSAALRAKTEETRSALLSAISHDLRTPLASITGAATALRDDGGLATNTRVELLESICDEAERLERLVANLLDMTRLESGPIVLKREWIPLEEMIGSALTRLERFLGERPVNIQIPNTLPLLSVDPILFEQVFVNLLENASRYTPAGSSIDIDARFDDNRKLTIEVGDSGRGFTPGSEERVFEKFYRGEHAGKSGAGLGLPICRAIVEAHGGTITAENRKSGGALVRITYPLGDIGPSIPPALSNADETRG